MDPSQIGIWENKSVLVTGSGGFIGSHLCEKLVLMNAKVRAFVRYNSMNSYGLLESLEKDIRDKLDIYAGDILDEASALKSMRDVEVLFHMAALPSIPYSLANPHHVFSVNTLGTVNVLLGAKAHGVRTVVLASSGGASEKRPLLSPYVTSKAAMEKIGMGFHQGFGMDVCVVRLLNNYGPRQSARAVIPTIISQALAKDDVHLGALEPAMDFNYVEDTVQAFLKAAESKDAIGQVLTWGTGVSTSIGDLAEMAFSIIGRESLHVVRDEQRVRPYRGPAASLKDDFLRTYDVLNYAPKVALEEGLRRTIDWISDHIGLYKTEVYSI